MTNNVPIKRHTALRTFSKEHHHGLLLSWKIQQGLKLNADPVRIWNYIDWFWENHLLTHFELEEQLLFPILTPEHESVKKAMAQHRRLRRLCTASSKDIRTLNSIAEELEKHIRFEERVLFNEIQQIATPEILKQIEQHHEYHLPQEWKDEFWKAP